VELWLNHWKSVFVESDISEPDESARHIMSAALSCSWADLDRLADTALSPDQLSDLERRCRCRLQRMPVQYIVGDWEFCDVTLTLRPPVFIPRPETEQLARLAADRLRRRADPAPRLLEVGCGSGAISVAVLHWLKQVSALAVDQSPAACQLTTENAARAGVSERLTVRAATLTEHGLPDAATPAGYDLVVSNPPYLRASEMRRLQPEILLYEDRAALDGGEDGLVVTRHLLAHAAGWLRPGGCLLLELDPAQPAAVGQLLERQQLLQLVQTHEDFAGKQRFVEVRRVEAEAGS